MRFPPLRLHFYGIRLRLLFSFLVISITFCLPLIFQNYEKDVFSIISLELIVVIFALGYHEFHTTSKSYLSLRNHRQFFFISSLLFGLFFSLVLASIAIAYYFVYSRASITSIDYFSFITLPILILYFAYLLGNCFAIIVKSRQIIWSFIGLSILLVALNYQVIWEKRYLLQTIFFLSLLLPSLIPFYLLLVVILIVLILLIIFNFVVYTKRNLI